MKIKISLIAFVILLLVSSCTRILLYNYGVRNPKIENSKSIDEFLVSNKLDTNNNFALKDTTALSIFIKSNIGTPEIRFYDKNGYLMHYKDDKKCNGQNDSLISFLNSGNVVKIDSSEYLFDYLDQIRTLEGQLVDEHMFKGYDYYLIIYWAKWLGKINSVKLNDWQQSLNKKNGLKIKTIKVTTDYMNFWPLNKKDMIKIYSPKIKYKDGKKEREKTL